MTWRTKWRGLYTAERAAKGRAARQWYYDKLIAEAATRFWSKVAKSDGCWEWTGTRYTTGYGQFGTEGRKVPAHRLAWELTTGEKIPAGLQACHHCDNRGCVRPSHIFIGTQSDNLRDMVAKGRGGQRGLPGERHPMAKLSAADVLEIRRRFECGEPRLDILRDFPIRRAQLNSILRRRSWTLI